MIKLLLLYFAAVVTCDRLEAIDLVDVCKRLRLQFKSKAAHTFHQILFLSLLFPNLIHLLRLFGPILVD